MTKTQKGLTVDELDVIDLLGNAQDRFALLPICHEDDDDEFRRAINAAQNIIMARAAVRTCPDDGFSYEEGFE